MVVAGQGQRGVLHLDEGRSQHLQDVKTSASKICRVPWINLPQTESFLDGSAARCGGYHSPCCPGSWWLGSGLQGI